MQIDRLDHLVLTVRDIKASVAFYTQVLGMRAITFGDNPVFVPSQPIGSINTASVRCVRASG